MRGLGEENEQALVVGFHPALVLSRCARGESERDADESWSQPLIRGPRAQRAPPVIDPFRQNESKKKITASNGQIGRAHV